MAVWHIVRVARKGKRLRAPEPMHNHIEADNRAEALQRFHAQYPSVALEGLEARVA